MAILLAIELGILLFGVELDERLENVVMDIKDNWLSIIVVSISILFNCISNGIYLKKLHVLIQKQLF